MSTIEKPVHRRLFAVEYDLKGATVDDRLGAVMLLLGDRVIATVRNQLVRSPNDRRVIQPRDPILEDEGLEIPAVVCTLPSNCKVPETAFVAYDPRVLYYGHRPDRLEFGRLCAAGVRAALKDSDFYCLEKKTEYTSGPKPINHAKLRAYAGSLAVLDRPVPGSAEDFAYDISEACNAIFAKVTGGSSMPEITCAVEYGTL